MSNSHICRDLDRLFKVMREGGFNIIIGKKCVKIIPPPKTGQTPYISHYGPRGFHPIRRYVKNQCKINLDQV